VRRDLAAVFGPRMTSSYSDDRSDPVEVQGNNRSVMPFDVRGRTRATLLCAGSFIVWCVSREARRYLAWEGWEIFGKHNVMGIDDCNCSS
jgi:hypothetical protein